jgi:carbamoyltransferase
VKRREAFRPFAPSVLDERGHEFFDRYEPNPFMLLVQPVRADRRAQIPAVTHVTAPPGCSRSPPATTRSTTG